MLFLSCSHPLVFLSFASHSFLPPFFLPSSRKERYIPMPLTTLMSSRRVHASRPERHRTTILAPRNFSTRTAICYRRATARCVFNRRRKKEKGKRKGKKRHETKRDRSSCIMNDEIVSRIDSPWFLSLSLNGCLGRKKKNHKLETSCGYRRRLVRHSRCGIPRCQWFPLYRRVQ